jgi:NDP-sugar pyrophosphorylase family protein
MHKFSEICDDHGIKIAGIFDKDYWGNTETIGDIPVIQSEEILDDPKELEYYKNNFNFFCAVNWMPMQDEVTTRNREKRFKLINLIETLKLPCISIVDSTARISKYAHIGNGCFIDGNLMIEHHAVVGDFCNIYAHCDIGHNSTMGKNCVMQRQVMLMSNAVVEDNVYISMCVRALKPHLVFKKNTFIHENIYIKRNTIENEIVSINGNTKRITIGYENSVVE